jgi:hypothetical protein
MVVAPLTCLVVMIGSATAAPADRHVGLRDPAVGANPQTAEDHRALAVAYELEARTAEEKAEIHRRMGQAYRQLTQGSRPAGTSSMAAYRARLEKTYAAAARDYRERAAEHRRLSSAAR